MNPYQGQQYYHNIGFSNQAPQTFGNPAPMPGFAAPGYPQQSPGGYPQPGGHPPSGYPSTTHTPGYPSTTPMQGYPSTTPMQGYPSTTPTPGYPSQGNHPQGQGYSQSNTGYPISTPGYPTQGYPSCNTSGNPQQSGYPQKQYQGYPPSAQNPSSSPYPSNPHTQQRVPMMQGLPTNQWTPPRGKPTVVPVNPFDPRSDAEILRKAMKGMGTDEKSIIKVLTRRSNEQRLRIAFEFKTLYGKDLVADLKSETSGKFEDLLVALMTPLPQFYAKELHHAMEGIGTDEDVLIEVMCTMSNHEINVIKNAYTAIYGTLLEDDLRGDTSGHFKRLMTALCVGNRSEDFHVDQARAREDAKSLLQAGELRLGTDESTFNMILCSRSYPQLAAIFHEYHQITGHDIDDALKNEFSGDLKDAMRAIVKVVRNKPLFFAEHLHKSMKGMGTNDRQLIRIMVTRSEVDLGDISDMFQSKYGESLASWIESDCSGHYKKCLLGLLGLY